TGTLRGTDPGFTGIGQLQLRPAATSALVSAGNPQPPAPPGFPFPSPLLLPQFDPPPRAKLPIGGEVARVPGARIDIGALESAAAGGLRLRRNGAQPLAPPRASAAAAVDRGTSGAAGRAGVIDDRVTPDAHVPPSEVEAALPAGSVRHVR